MQCDRVLGHKLLRRLLSLLSPLLALAGFFLLGCSALAPEPQPVDLVVLHTSDVHGHIEPAT